MLRYDANVIEDHIHLARYWIINGHKKFNLNRIKLIEFDVRHKFPYEAKIIEDVPFSFSLNQKLMEKLKAIAIENNIECKTINDRRFL